MKVSEVYQKITNSGIMPTVFVYSVEDTVELAKTLQANGVHVVELLQRTQDALEAIRVVKERVPGMIVGAGTVLNTETAESVYRMGADFIVSPYYHQNIVDRANAHELAVIQGCANISEISLGYDKGMTGKITERTADGFPAVADLTDATTEKRICLVARYSL